MVKEYHFISKNRNVVNYVERMANWIEENSSLSAEEIKELFLQDQERIVSIFEPYPETIFHDDPAKWAEMLAISWELIEEPELEFV